MSTTQSSEILSTGHWPVLASSVLVIYFLHALWVAYGSPLRKIPGPRIAKFTRLWLFNETRKFRMNKDYQEYHEKYGKLVRVAPNKVSVADPEVIQTVYKIGSKFNKSAMYDSFKGLYKGQWLHNVFSTRDPHWHKEVRGSVASKYSLSSLKQMEPMVDECSSIFIETMKELSGRPIDLGKWVQWYAFDVIGEITFLRRFGFMENRKDEYGILDNFEITNQYSTFVAQLPGLHRLILGNAVSARLLSTSALQNLDPLIKVQELIRDTLIEYEKRDDGEQRGDFLSFLRQAQEKDPNRYTDRFITSSLSVNIIAGSDTTGTSLRSIFYYLMKTPEKMQKLVAEIDNAEKNGRLSPSITFQEASSLPYLQAVIKEALRMCPAVGLSLERVVPPGGAVISGTYLPAGTVVGANAWVLHRNPTAYAPDPHAFRPERWLDSDTEQLKLMEQSFFAFGAGSRACLGRNISMLEMSKFVPQVLRHFEMEWVGENGKQEWDIKASLLCKQHGVIATLRERKKNSGN